MIINGDKIEASSDNNQIGVSNGTTIGVGGRGFNFSSLGASVTGGFGTIAESLWSLCDGSTHSILSGNYTVQNVIAQQSSTGTYTDITGSVISYVPPLGTTKVIYRFIFSIYWVSTHAINHFKFLIYNVDVTNSRHTRATSLYLETRASFEWVIDIGVPDNPNTGSQSTWTTPKTLKMQNRWYGGSNYGNLHGIAYWDGAVSNVFNMPIINIIALR